MLNKYINELNYFDHFVSFHFLKKDHRYYARVDPSLFEEKTFMSSQGIEPVSVKCLKDRTD